MASGLFAPISRAMSSVHELFARRASLDHPQAVELGRRDAPAGQVH
jgi:hypothetical protein